MGIIAGTSAKMRSNFLLILGLCLHQSVLSVSQGVCYEKDEAPVDVDVLYDDDCVDLQGNIYGLELDSELQSCCDCFSYKCEKIGNWRKQLKVGWVRSVSAQCCQNCNGTVFPPNTVISTTQLEDDCLTTQTEVCRVKPGLKTAVIEQEFSYRNCCNDNNNTLHPPGSEVADPRTCSVRFCSYDEPWPHAVWFTEKVWEGCDCCLLPNGTMVPDGATWWDTSVTPPLMLECCRGQIVTPVASNHTEPPPPCGEYGIILTGGQYDEITTELFIPQPCPGGIQHCLLPDFAKVQRYRHTQDGFMACGGSGHQRDCITLDPGTGIWQTSYTWEDPGRYGHVSWVSPYGQTPVIMGVLMGGFGPFTTTGLTTTLLTMASGVPGFGFGLLEPSVGSCSIQFEDFVIVTGSIPYTNSEQVIKYFADGTSEVLPSLLIPRRDHSCGSYIHDGKEMLIVVTGDTMPTWNSTEVTNTVEIYDLTTPGSAWLPTTNFPITLSGSRGVTLDNIFYVTGGELIWEWNPLAETWTEVSPMCVRRIFHGASMVPVTDDLLLQCTKTC